MDLTLAYRETHLRNLQAYLYCVIANWGKEIILDKHKYTECFDLQGSPKSDKKHLILEVSPKRNRE